MMCIFLSSLLVIVCTLTTVTCDVEWTTPARSEWSFECPNGRSLKLLQSARDVANNDRLWTFGCGGNDSKITNVTCEWSAYANDFGQTFNYQCPNDGVITGMASYYAGTDRRYQFLCCFPTGYIAHACVFTPNINALGEFMNYRRPDYWYIRGYSSSESLYHQQFGMYDRMFTLNICKLDKLVPSKC
ncbi:unnamed protein product [Lymnaea stagnalis]|uniref:Dermatopontin n=1 Tax=Lymnaea stagnalis TaxID=6523 RepID=A0AAV2I6K0_LYMST